MVGLRSTVYGGRHLGRAAGGVDVAPGSGGVDAVPVIRGGITNSELVFVGYGVVAPGAAGTTSGRGCPQQDRRDARQRSARAGSVRSHHSIPACFAARR